MDLFLNELSVSTPALSIMEANKRLCELVSILKNISVDVDGIRIPENFANIELGPEYRLKDWLYSYDEETKDLKTLFLTKVAVAPYIEEIINSVSNNKLIEFVHGDNVCLGLGLASHILFDTISVSFNLEIWNEHQVPISVTIYDGEELIVDNIFVRHISNMSTLNEHTGWLENITKPIVKSGKQLWLKREELYPRLIFCDSVRNQISWLHEGNPQFHQILNRLAELNRFCVEWPENTPFDNTRFESKITPESSTRLITFENQLTILCPDGKYRLFSWHARFTPGAGRIHFYENVAEKRLIIGSIADQNIIK